MKVHEGLFIGLTLLALFFFAVFFVVGKIHYSGKYKQSFSIRNMFPFEYNYNSHFFDNFYSNLGIILSVSLTITYYSFFIFAFRGDGLLVALGIAGLVCSACTLFLPFVPFKDVKLHVAIDALLFVFVLVHSGLLLVSGYKYRSDGGNVMFMVIFYIGILLSLINVVLIINPKLTTRFKPVEKVNENGEKVYERPKYIVWAFTEWLIVFAFYLQLIVSTLFVIAL